MSDETKKTESSKPAPAPAPSEPMVTEWRIEGSEWKEFQVPQSQARVEFEPKDHVNYDAMGLGEAYQTGDAARFQFGWGAHGQQGEDLMRSRGWLPWKKPLDDKFSERRGAVSHGTDAVLYYRPWDVVPRFHTEPLAKRLEAITEKFQDEMRRAAKDEKLDDDEAASLYSQDPDSGIRMRTGDDMYSRSAQAAKRQADQEFAQRTGQHPDDLRQRAMSRSFPNNPFADKREQLAAQGLSKDEISEMIAQGVANALARMNARQTAAAT